MYGNLKNKSVRPPDFDVNSALIHNHNLAFTPTTSNKIKINSEPIYYTVHLRTNLDRTKMEHR